MEVSQPFSNTSLRLNTFLVVTLANVTCLTYQNVAKKLIYLDPIINKLGGNLGFQNIVILLFIKFADLKIFFSKLAVYNYC